MPDELSGEAQYPWKLRFTILGEETDVSLEPGARAQRARVEALRLSAISQGRGDVAPVAGSPLLERYLSSTVRCTGSTSPADLEALAEEFARLVEQAGCVSRATRSSRFSPASSRSRSRSSRASRGPARRNSRSVSANGAAKTPTVGHATSSCRCGPDWTGPEFLFGYPEAR